MSDNSPTSTSFSAQDSKTRSISPNESNNSRNNKNSKKLDLQAKSEKNSEAKTHQAKNDANNTIQDQIDIDTIENEKNGEEAVKSKMLWINNVPKTTKANEIKKLLLSYGSVDWVKIVVNVKYPGTCYFAHVKMGSSDDVLNAINMVDNTEFNGNIIRASKFEDRRSEELHIHQNVDSDKSQQNTSISNTEKDSLSVNVSPSISNDHENSRNDESRKSHGSDQIRNRHRRSSPARDRYNNRSKNRDILTFNKIKEERERQRRRDRERAIREENRRRREEETRARELRESVRRQRIEVERLQRERERLRLEREQMEKEKLELIKLERERQKVERDRLEMERIALERSRKRLEEDHRGIKRPAPSSYKRENSFQEQKNSSRNRYFDNSQINSHYSNSSSLSRSESDSKKYPSKSYKLPTSYDRHESFMEKKARLKSNSSTMKYVDNKFQSRSPLKMKTSKYVDKEKTPEFRSFNKESRNSLPQVKSDVSSRSHYYSHDKDKNNRWNQSGTSTSNYQSQTLWTKNKWCDEKLSRY